MAFQNSRSHFLFCLSQGHSAKKRGVDFLLVWNCRGPQMVGESNTRIDMALGHTWNCSHVHRDIRFPCQVLCRLPRSEVQAFQLFSPSMGINLSINYFKDTLGGFEVLSQLPEYKFVQGSNPGWSLYEGVWGIASVALGYKAPIFPLSNN